MADQTTLFIVFLGAAFVVASMMKDSLGGNLAGGQLGGQLRGNVYDGGRAGGCRGCKYKQRV